MNTLAIEPMAQPVAGGRFVASWRVFALFGFAGWVLLVGSHHEPWFDEAQAWLIARDNSLWDMLAHRVRYEGTPGLWHTVLWLAIRAGLPYRLFFVLPATFAIAGGAVVLWRAPFPAPLRVLLLTSYFFAYQFSVVARSYCLDLLLVPMAASFFADRVKRPMRYAIVIGLIANANAHGFLVSGVLGLELAWRMLNAGRLGQTSNLLALATTAGLGLLALVCAWQPGDNGFLQPQSHANPIMTLSVYLCNAFVDHVALWNPATVSKYDVFASVLLTFILQRPVIALILAGKDRAMAFALLGVLLVFSALVYATLWHAGIFFLFWIFVLWVQWGNPVSASDRRQVIAAMTIILSLQTIQALRTGLWDIAEVYSPGQQTAQVIRNWHAAHPHGRIYAYGDYAFGVQPWLDGNTFANYHNGDPRLSYIRWDRHEPWMAGTWTNGTQMQYWHQVLAEAPDLIVASPVNRNWAGGYRANLVPEACRAGYGVLQNLPGALIWRGALTGDQSLIVFERKTHGPCARR